MKRVRLDDLVEAIGADPAEGVWYVDTESGTTELVTENVMDAVLARSELAPQTPADVKLMFKLASEIVYDEDGRFIKLPGQLDVLEWDIMRRFSQTLTEPQASAEFTECVRGSNAFRGFNTCLRKYKLHNDWEIFRERALRNVAVQFCEQHNIPFE